MSISMSLVMSFQRLLGHGLARYLNVVWSSSRVVYDPDKQALRSTSPAIIAAWHGHHFMAPFVRQSDQDCLVLIAYGTFGSVYTHAFSKLGLKVIRGSSGRDSYRTGGFRGLRQMLRALELGSSVALTVDIQPVARVVGDGVLALARHSGRPIIPLAAVTSRRIVLNWRWDRPAINLPFGRIVVARGNPIFVSNFQDSEYVEKKRRELQDALNFLNARAVALADS